MIIGLFGFSFEDRNKGCEALTYSFISVLNKIIPEGLTIINLSGVGGVSRISKNFPNIKFEVTGFQKENIRIRSFMKLLSCDCIFDCTFGDNFSDIYSLKFVNRTTNYKELALFFRKRFVLAPQTIGPFHDEKLKKRVRKILIRSDIVFSRDKLTTQYVKKISGIDAVTVTDLAFLLPYDKTLYQLEKKKKIGINVSGLLWYGGFSQNNQFSLSVDYRKYINNIIISLKDKGYQIHLIPHVFSENMDEIDEDSRICKELSKKYEIKYSGKFDNPIEAKSYISNMEYFIGARMHSTVAAFSSGVITIPFSYSRKFEGLYNSLNYYRIIDGKTLTTEEAVSRTLEFLDNIDKLRNEQILSLRLIDELSDKFKYELAQYIQNIS